MGGGFGQYGNMGNGMGITGFYVGSAYDSALMAADLKYKNSLLRGDLAYKVTARSRWYSHTSFNVYTSVLPTC